jgi:hypothetical protein
VPEALHAWRTKAETGSAPEISTEGQFYVARRLAAALTDRINALKARTAGTPVEAVASKELELLDAIRGWDDENEPRLRAELSDLLKKLPAGSDAQEARAIAEGGVDGAAAYSKAHAARRRGEAVDVSGWLTLGHYTAIYRYEAEMCGRTAGELANEVVAKGGLTERTPDPPGGKLFHDLQLITGRVTRDATVTRDGRTRGDSLEYIKDLKAKLEVIKQGLDAGRLWVARVESGIGSDDKKPPVAHDEHSIVIIGYDTPTGDFVFWDPDAGASTWHGRGFGQLYFDPYFNRLTTAENDNEFMVDSGGHQPNGEKRYQVMAVVVK